MVEADKVLKETVKSGEVKIGAKETKSSIEKGDVKLIVIANNCPYSSEINELAKKKKIPIYSYASSSIDLGYICGKTFAVSVFAVINDGGANILGLVKKR